MLRTASIFPWLVVSGAAGAVEALAEPPTDEREAEAGLSSDGRDVLAEPPTDEREAEAGG